MPKDKFDCNQTWLACLYKTLVVNVDKDGNCNPPCRRVVKSNKKIKKYIK